MDPEVIAQLEEQLRELTDLLANQNSIMQSQMDAMNKVAGSASSAASATRKNTESSGQATTKYTEAQEKAATASGKSEVASKALAAGFGTLSASVSGLVGVFGSLGGSLLSAEQNLAKYGKVADSAASAAESITKSIPIVGDALGGLVGVLGKVAAQVLTDGLKLVDTFVDMRDGITQVGGALPVTGEELIKLANNAGYFGERMQVLGKITAGVGTGLATLGTTAGQGATKFMELAAVSDDLRRQYGRLGISQERLTEMQGMYIKSQEASGLSMQNQTRTAAQLRKESLAYVDNMTRLSALTGKQAEQLQSEQDVVASQIQERLEVVKENAQIKALKKAGDADSLAQAADIERRQQDRAKFRQELTAAVGPGEATKIMKIIRSGVYDSTSAAYANLGIDIAKYGDVIRKGGADTAEAARGLVGELDTGKERMATSLGAGTEFASEDTLTNIGIGDNEALGRMLTRAGKNYEAASDQAEKDIADKKKAGDDLADMVENVRATERQFQAMYQKFLLDKIMKLSSLLKDFDLLGYVTKNFRDIITKVGIGLGVLTAASAAFGAALAALKLYQFRSAQKAIAAQEAFTKSLNSSTLAMREQTQASKTATAADRSEASGSRRAAAADNLESSASKRAAQADQRQASASQKAAAASQRAATASQRAAAASQRAAAADMREAAASMKAAAADLRESRASDAAAAADRREAKSGGGGLGGGFGRFAKGAAIAAGVAYGTDALLGAVGVGKNLDTENIQSQDDKNWERASAWEKTQSSLARGIEHIGRFMFLDNIANQAQADRVKSETEYLTKKYGPEAAGTTASPTMVEMTKPVPIDQASIDQMGLSEPELAKAMRTGQLDANSALLASMEDAQQQLQGTQGKTYAEAVKQAEEDVAKRAEQSQKYTIQQGDTLSELAEKFGTTVDALMDANKQITNKDLIYTGEELNIPGSQQQQYAVQKGDTLRKIAEQYGMSHEDLLKANPNLKNKDWKEGYKLNIPNQLGSASQFLDPAALAQLGLGGAGAIGMFGTPGAPDQESMEEMMDSMNARKRQSTDLIDEQQAATDRLSSSVTGYDKTLESTNKSLALFRDLLDSLNYILSPTAARSGQVSATGPAAAGGGGGGGGGGGTDPAFSSSAASSQIGMPSGMPGGMPSGMPGGMPGGMPSFAGGMPGGMMGGLAGPNGMMGMPMTGFDGNMGRILATIRQIESGGKYDTPGPKGMPGSASGAYAFIDSSWRGLTKKYGIGTEYARAFMAPPAIQDQVAARYAQEILTKAGNDVSKIPIAWYTGNINGQISSSAIAANNGLTPQAYQQKWLAAYMGGGGMPMMSGGGMPGMGMPMFGGMGMGGMMGGDGGLISNLAMMSNMMGMMGGGMGGMGGMMGGGDPRFGNMGMMGGGMGGGGQMAALQLASQYLGMSETKDRQAIASFLKAGGAGLDPKVEAWCAAFVNSALQQSGIRGTGSAVANSFQTWGIGVPINQSMPGDVVLETRGKPAGATGGHVGLATGKNAGGKIGMLSGNSSNKVTDMMIPADGDVMVRRGQLPMAEKGGVFKGPDSGYLAMLHGKEAVVPLDNRFTRTQSSEQYTVNGRQVGKREYDSFMKSHPELQNIQQKVQSMMGSMSDKSMDPSRVIGSVSKLMDSNLTGIKDEIIDKNEKIQQSLIQMVNNETNKAIKAVNESNAPIQTISNEISNSMRKVMDAHNQTMSELTYRLGEMIDAMNTSNDVTKKILKKAST